MHSLFGWAENAAGYAQTFVYSEADREVTLSLGADDFLRLWLNGRQVFEHPKFLNPGEGRVDVKLQKGWNALLAKVVNDRIHHRLQLQILDTPDPSAPAATTRPAQ
jgi:hypothetical protein